MSRKRKEDFMPMDWANYYEALANKNYMDYQSTGEPRYDRAYYQYDQIAGAFRALAREKDGNASDIKKRMANCDGVIGRLIPGKMYNRDEVVKMLKEAIWW